MDKSLDDIIKQNKGSRFRGGRRGGSSRSGGGSGGTRRGPSIRGGGNRKPGGGVMRGRSRGGIARRSSGSFGRSSSSFVRSRPSASVKREAFLGSSSSSSVARKYGSDATKLIVSNLDFGVTDSDILELFSEFGPLKSAGVHYDRSGRSLGSADLIFERRADAIKAMKQYNGVPLDGREMNIQLATSEIPGISARGSRLSGSSGPNSNFKSRGSMNRSRRGGPPSRRGSSIKRGAGGKPGGRGREPKKQPTAEELDAELEEYVKSKVSNSEGA